MYLFLFYNFTLILRSNCFANFQFHCKKLYYLLVKHLLHSMYEKCYTNKCLLLLFISQVPYLDQESLFILSVCLMVSSPHFTDCALLASSQRREMCL